MLGCIWVSLGVFMFIITFANLSFFELSEKFGVSVWEVLSHIWRVTSLCLSGFEACFTDGSLCVDGLSFTVCFVSEVLPDLTYFFKTSRGRSARAPAHEAMSPLRWVKAVCCMGESWAAPPLQSMRAGSLTGSGTVSALWLRAFLMKYRYQKYAKSYRF